MTTDRDTARILAPPPLLFFACLLLGWGLGFIQPFEPFDIGIGVRLVLGNALLLGALVLAIPALLVMHRFHTPAEPWKPTTSIVTSGPFGFTRNPIYVALLLVLASIAVFIASGWLMLLVPVLYALLHYGVVRPEERYLTGKFGDEYVKYMTRVRRWM